ncbi:MAG TPA: CapA family protein [Candidatus Krumholzibacteria bacterium]|nr:CapA family protein [Candidatus Krumholzibacteria bacterium]HPD72901.1 CapA family protein [Candidatus Krumholzibacteria bacterium]HRY41700.1 CapA family protein [Candidatus Krumholzibacteria bacterium]
MRCRSLVCIALLLASVAVGRDRGVLIEDFEAPTLELESYPEQDDDPDDWALTGDAHAGQQALRLFGNTWKVQVLDAPVAVTDTTVWQVAVRADRIGEIQALGLGDGANELFYTFWGTQLQAATNWWTVYQGARDRGEWCVFLLPVGEDWTTTFGAPPAAITRLVYVNDADSVQQPGVTFFDDLRDVTEDLPHAPRCRILSSVQSMRKVAAGLLSVDVQFQAKVFDPDSDTFAYAWDFGDSTGSDLAAPQHTFLVQANHPWTVGLVVADPEGLAGGDTCRVRVEDGPSELPLTVNLVGDVFTGRGYETPGGIIDTYGVEALFEPTLDIFGLAADVNVANLEVSYTDRGTPHPTKSVVFRSRPENIVGLAYAGIDLVTIGNNHIIDYGEIGMLDTMDGLDGLGIPYCGAGVNEYFALLPAYHGAKGLRLAFVGLCNRTGREWNYQPFLDAGYSKPGFAYLLPDNLQKAIDACRAQADLVIVQTHSGPEYAAAPPARGGDLAAPPPVEASEPVPGAPEFHFRNEPTPGDRELRRLGLDLGADVVINHHPHVLQGFEAHDGKLIAHSLGNFVFDLYYPETMPTMVLTLEIGAAGITGYTFTPAWINHWIPEPATGSLARHILERLADYSRPMNALVVPEPDGVRGRIFLSRAEADSTVLSPSATVALEARDGYAISAPLPVGGDAYFSGFAAIAEGGGGWEARWGRDLLWHGGFESEGADLWDANTDDEWFDETIRLGGQRSLGLRRDSSDQAATGTDLERHLPCDPAREHSAVGWLRGENAPYARTMARFYSSRTNETPVSSTDLADPATGDFEWTRQWRDLVTPANAIFFELRCNAEPPDGGTGIAWFDELALIEWEDWRAVDAPLDAPAPSNVRYLQVRRAGTGPAEATVIWRETRYADAATHAPAVVPPVEAARLVCYPNPCNPRTTVQLELPGQGARDCEVALYDLRGRRVAILYRGPLAGPGPHGFTWDGRDDAGRALASGVYVARGAADGRVATAKVVLVR